ncbi:peptidylprolyl isomerase [Bacteroides sp. 214]|uniref:FKBP-type peptidyl-prolyl cis-trans isomerase n=1 Tax=Bacteroides sp. 214 TaxID=2302935 RepID=UPI0013D53620|nr:FKBP-type peptidyl-prolyl cis-trans isomerase [Bacteroides sp. 214]NDW12495.1 peptidylprolyl isomerase [Bacteroides sp. 214]
MNKLIGLFSLLLVFTLFFASCEETSEVDKYANWRERNEAFIDSLARTYDTDPELFRLRDSRDQSQYVYFKKRVSVDEGQSPFLTSKVTVFYRGMLINEAVFAAGGQKYYTSLYKSLDVFDTNFKGNAPDFNDTPTLFSVAGVVNGWVEALQHMKPGERWEIYIPWRSGYGSSESGAIPAYSVLMLDLTLVDVDLYP